MTKEEPKKSDLGLNYKAVVVIAIILVSTHLIGIFGGYQYLAETFQEIPVSMVEPSMSVQCQRTITEYNDLKAHLGIGDVITHETKITWSDLEKYNELKTKIRELGC